MKKLWILGLVLALAVTLLLPSVAMAAGPDNFTAQGALTAIDNGNVNELSDGQWLVTERHIQGKFIKSVQGKSNKINGDFTITYGGIFDLDTQAGNFKGKMESRSVALAINGSTQPLALADIAVPDGLGGTMIIKLPKLTISGDWTGVQGLKAEGEFNAYIVFIPTPDNHVGTIVKSEFSIIGDYLNNN